MPSRMAALTSNQGRNGCNRTVAPASPNAPRNVRGKQQARVDSTAITAATGVARSATRMRIFTPSASRLKSLPAITPLAECRSDFHTGDTLWSVVQSQAPSRTSPTQCFALPVSCLSVFSRIAPVEAQRIIIVMPVGVHPLLCARDELPGVRHARSDAVRRT